MRLNPFKSVNENFRIKIFVAFVLLIFFISSSFTVFFLHRQSRSLTDALMKNGDLLAGVLAFNSRIGVFSESDDLLEVAADGILRQEGILRVSIFNVDGKLLKSKEKTGIGTLGEAGRGDEANRRNIMEIMEETVSPVSRSGDNAAEFWSPVVSSSDSYGEPSLFFKDDSPRRKGQVIGFAAITVDKRPLNKALDDLLFKTIFMVIVFLIVGSVIAYLVVRGITRPLNRLIESVKTFGTVGTVEKVAVETEDEIGNLAQAFNNMTDRLGKREKALRDSEDKYKELSDSIADVFFAVDNDLKCTYWNKTSEDLTGIAAGDAVGKAVGAIFPGMLESGTEKDSCGPASRDRGLQPFLYEYQTGGRQLTFEVSVYPARTGLSVYAKDVTDRRRMEEALRESERELRFLIESAPDAIFIHVGGCFVYLNQKAVRLFGAATAKDLLGQPIIDRFHPDYRKSMEERYRMLNERKSVPPVEHQYIQLDGSVIDVEASAVPITYENRAASLAFARDITERKRAEQDHRALQERLQRSERMEAVGQLAGGVAHDLNNVLGISMIYSELLQENIPEGSPLRKSVDSILASSQKAAAIIEDLLTLARRNVVVSEVTNLNCVVSDFLKAPVFEKIKGFNAHVTFSVELDEDLLNIKGSPVHLEKTVMNLVSNAAEAISGNGEVSIRTESRYLDKPISGYDTVLEGDYAVLTVSDTGMGIPAEHIGKIFEPFYTKKTMGRSGTGLGLAIVWGTVKDHNGYVDVRSVEGKGTTFTLFFPVTSQAVAKDATKIPIEQYIGHGESVLVVDDVAEQRQMATTMLTRLGYRVDSVPSGEEAVEYLKNDRADILVLDMIMDPGIDGMETYKRIREINPTQKAIIVSGFSETERVKEAQALGAGAYVKKPYVMEKVGMAIRRELDGAGARATRST